MLRTDPQVHPDLFRMNAVSSALPSFSLTHSVFSVSRHLGSSGRCSLDNAIFPAHKNRSPPRCHPSRHVQSHIRHARHPRHQSVLRSVDCTESNGFHIMAGERERVPSQRYGQVPGSENHKGQHSHPRHTESCFCQVQTTRLVRDTALSEIRIPAQQKIVSKQCVGRPL